SLFGSIAQAQTYSEEPGTVEANQEVFLNPIEVEDAEIPSLKLLSNSKEGGDLSDPTRNVLFITRDGSEIPIHGLKEGSPEHHRYLSMSAEEQMKFKYKRMAILKGAASFLTLLTRAGKRGMRLSGIYWLSNNQWTLARLNASKSFMKRMKEKLRGALGQHVEEEVSIEGRNKGESKLAPVRSEFLHILNEALLASMTAVATPRTYHLEINLSLISVFGARGWASIVSKYSGLMTLVLQLSFDSKTGELIFRALPKVERLEKVLTLAGFLGFNIRVGMGINGESQLQGFTEEKIEDLTTTVVTLPGPFATSYSQEGMFFGLNFPLAVPGVFPLSEVMSMVTRSQGLKFRLHRKIFRFDSARWAESLGKLGERMRTPIVDSAVAQRLADLKNHNYVEYMGKIMKWHRLGLLKSRALGRVTNNIQLENCRKALTK
ncbi:MAG: hypothetical protein KDD35_09650, partial [Bdellovibrionales bacterium]|nr:hypothetical protein [Bdellovibrionales bacterium]